MIALIVIPTAAHCFDDLDGENNGQWSTTVTLNCYDPNVRRRPMFSRIATWARCSTGRACFTAFDAGERVSPRSMPASVFHRVRCRRACFIAFDAGERVSSRSVHGERIPPRWSTGSVIRRVWAGERDSSR
jgi:hypothetical protein